MDEAAPPGTAPPGKRIGVVAGAFVVPVVLASLIAFGVGGDSSGNGPGTGVDPVRKAAPATTPAGEPTYGKYVLPEPGPQAGTKAPPRRAPVPETTPRRTKPAPSPTPTRTKRPCPPGWQDVWWMRRWCERHGDGDGPGDRDGHRGR